MSTPGAIVIPAVTKHTATVILAHGLGDTGAGWAGIARNFRRRSKLDEVAFIFPNAPTIPITINGGMRMPGWFDIRRLKNATSVEDLSREEDEEGILRCRDYFHSLIRDETTNKGIPSERIVIGGFSQGGAITLLSGVSCPTKLGGIFGLSSYLPLRDKLKDMIPSDNPNSNTKIFMAHGMEDPLVRYDWGIKTGEKLTELGYTVDFRGYACSGLDHSADVRELDHFENYLAEVLPPTKDDQLSEL
ncbi:hypothetical protein FGG08_005191 [Glutinoglossum americanum]|uniref:Acyl-protein thioesterase 1 n=1 Tax=Glutinoglossum americanum TaxID=1670608 RepID=A0A9P8I3J3_9PEZI|nr:hypothetical protein FGG08_005191 [Glutinoglossum americanum]